MRRFTKAELLVRLQEKGVSMRGKFSDLVVAAENHGIPIREEVQKKQAISLSEVKEILGKVDVEEMDQIQRWTYDYVSKFSSIDANDAKDMKKQLIKDCELTEDEAVEIVNIRPTSMAELRSFTFGWKKLILAETLEKILKIIQEHS